MHGLEAQWVAKGGFVVGVSVLLPASIHFPGCKSLITKQRNLELGKTVIQSLGELTPSWTRQAGGEHWSCGKAIPLTQALAFLNF